jgi:hypothetical protein
MQTALNWLPDDVDLLTSPAANHSVHIVPNQANKQAICHKNEPGAMLR